MKQPLFSRMDAFFSRYSGHFIVGITAVNLLLAFLFFDTKVSLSGDDAELLPLLPALKENNLNFTLDYISVFTHIAAHNDILCYSPGNLYNDLRNRNIQYMLMASLRINSAQNTGNIINTLQRYIYIVTLKYPDIVKQQCHSIGDSEPATLLELQY